MKFLLIFLVPVVLSVKLDSSPELGSLDDYAVVDSRRHPGRDDDPRECLQKADRAVRTRWEDRIKPMTAERLDRAEVIIRDCIDNMAKINKKVDEVKEALSDKLFETFKFVKVHETPCNFKFKIQMNWDNLEDKACYKSSRTPEEDCSQQWGTNGCMIDLWRKECGEGVVQGMREVMPFVKRDHRECVALYSHKFNV